jgi:hypothetical protein
MQEEERETVTVNLTAQSTGKVVGTLKLNLTVGYAAWFKSPEGQAHAIKLLEAEFGEGGTEKL